MAFTAEELQAMPIEQLRALAAAKKQVAPTVEQAAPASDQIEGSARSVLSKVTGGYSEPVVAALDSVSNEGEGTSPNPNPDHSFSGAIANIKKRYNDSLARGQNLIQQYPAGDVAETAARSVVEPMTFGLSEPAISGAEAAYKSYENGDAFGDEFKKAVQRRERDQAKLPAIDVPAQAAGFAFAPTGVLRKGLGMVAPEVASTLFGADELAATAQQAEPTGVFGHLVNSLRSGAQGGAKLAADVGEQSAARQATLVAPGFVDPNREQSTPDAMGSAFKIGALTSALPDALKAAGTTGQYFLSAVMGAPKLADQQYYMKNWQRLQEAEPKLGGLNDQILDAIQKVRDDYNSKAIDTQAAKEKLQGLETTIRQSEIENKAALRDKLKDAQNNLNLEFAEHRAGLKDFQKQIPQQMMDQVQEAVQKARQDVSDSHVEKLNVLKSSDSQVPLSGLDKTIDDAIGGLNVAGKGPLGQEATAALERLKGWKNSLNGLGKSVSASDAWKVVNQIDKDTEYFRSLTSFRDTADATMGRVRGELQQRIADTVPGYADALAKNRDAGRFLDEVTEHFDSPDKIVSSLSNISDPTKFRQRDVLQRLGENAGTDFGGVIDAAQSARDIVNSPKAMADYKASLPQAEAVRQAQQELDAYRFPHEVNARIQATVAASPEAANYAAAQKAQAEASTLDDMFKGFSDMTIDSKVRSIMNGKEALKQRMANLGQLSDQDFLKSIEDLRVLSGFNKTSINGSRRVNLFATLGYAAGSSNPEKRGALAALGATAASMVDQYGPKMSRTILDGVMKVNGLVTADKLSALPLPAHVKQDLINQFGRALYYGEDGDFHPNVQLSPDEQQAMKREIQQSRSMSTVEKGKAVTQINKTGQFGNLHNLLMGAHKVSPALQLPPSPVTSDPYSMPH